MVKGIDTSEHQAGKVDYASAKAHGYDFVILRIGYNTRMDKYFESDYTRAKASGLKVGVYFYPTTTTESGAVADAQRVINWLVGKFVDLPIVYDMEEKSMNTASRKNANSAQYNAWSKTMAEAGYKSMLYTGEYMFKGCFNGDAITDPLWIAKYSVKSPSIGRDYVMWQYTSNAYADDFYTNKLDRSYCYDESIFTSSVDTTATETKKTTSSVSGYTRTQFIKDVQSVTGSTVDGIAGKQTLSNTVTLSKTKNSRHAVVKYVQQFLIQSGYSCGSYGADGSFGSATEIAVKNYQQDHGCTVDGEITAKKKTWKCLLGM